MCEVTSTCRTPGKYWVQALGNSSNQIACGRHLSTCINHLTTKYDVTVKTIREVVFNGVESKVWGNGQANAARDAYNAQLEREDELKRDGEYSPEVAARLQARMEGR